jgi:hypothetical protein
LHGRKFYGLETEGLVDVELKKVEGEEVKRYAFGKEGDEKRGEVVTFWEGKKLGWELVRKD